MSEKWSREELLFAGQTKEKLPLKSNLHPIIGGNEGKDDRSKDGRHGQ